MTASLYATDFLGDTPSYINDGNLSKCLITFVKPDSMEVFLFHFNFL